jgi:cysteine desulfurase
VQAAGRLPIDVDALGVDLMSLTAHKMYGPKGVGALYVRSGATLSPMLAGGGQERGLRSGTLNVAGIVGFGAAAAAARRDLEETSGRESQLRDLLWREIQQRCDGVAAVSLNGHPVRRLPNNLNVAFDGIESEALITCLREVAALSAGSACASGSSKGSYVIRALGLGEERARCSVRFGLGRSTTRSDVETVARSLGAAVARLAALAPGRAGVQNDLIST